MKNSRSKRILAGLTSACMIASSAAFLSVSAAEAGYGSGDANCDGSVDISDSVKILQYVANSEKYPLSEQGLDNADVSERGDGITGQDAIAIQMLDAKLISTLPRS